MDHSYEEIRRVAIDVIADREKIRRPPNQYVNLRNGVAEVLQRRDGSPKDPHGRDPNLSTDDREIYLEVFWDLFRQGIITLGLNDGSPQFPFFRISSFGKEIIEHEDVYFFHDLSSYEGMIRDNIPDIDDQTVLYLKEAMQAFLVGCRLSSSVMLGVAIEHSLENLYETISQNSKYQSHFEKVREERTLLRRYNKFKNKLNEKNKELPSDVKEDLTTNLDMIVSIIRNYRNESGHPSGKILSRDQCYVNLQLFIPCCKKIYDLKDFFR